MDVDVLHEHRLPPEEQNRVRELIQQSCAKSVLDYLSHQLFHEESQTHAIGSCFHHLLLDLLVRGRQKASPEQIFVALSQLIGFHDVATQFAHSLYGNATQMLPFPPEGFNKRPDDQIRCLKACLTFLWFDQKFFSKAFDWTPVLQMTHGPDVRVAWLATHCVHVISDSSLHEAGQLLSSRFPSADFDSIRLQFHDIFKGRAADGCSECDLAAAVQQILQPSDLSEAIFSVNGVLLPQILPQNSEKINHVVVTDRFRNDLTLLAKQVQSSIPVIVKGPVGCGKTCLIEHLANLTERKCSPFLTKVQLGNQIDSKLLIGGYFATEVPGEFVWRPGPLTAAMLNGYWILFEDIDAAAPDVVAVLLTAFKSNSLSSLPGSNITASKHGNFRMFFTVRSDSESVHLHDSLPAELRRVCGSIEITAPDDDELAVIITEGWPNLKSIIPGIIGTFRLASQVVPDCPVRRSVTLRDLVKWCRRIDCFFSGSSRHAAKSAFKDAIDCFVPNPAAQLSKVQILGTHLNISKAEASLLVLDDASPPVVAKNGFVIGRVHLEIKGKDLLSLQTHWVPKSFAFTHQSLLLVERIAAAVHGNEPILLVGETGTGKTSTIQFLAQELGQQLIVVNLNQQTDTCDLVGGYKPADLSVTFVPLVQSFARLVMESFPNKTKNAAFVQRVSDCLLRKEYATVCDVIVSVNSKISKTLNDSLKVQWNELVSRVALLRDQVKQNQGKSVMVFAFIEGSLVKAMREGHWILLDEINLAEADVLQSLCHVLDTSDSSVVLIDKADGTPVCKHPDFRIFACMNPATDVGKKDLPLGIRNRFTEFHVNELLDERDLRILVQKYLPATKKLESVIQFYIEVRGKCMTLLTDTCGHRPHFSLRTLCRALSVAASNPCQDASRSLYEAFCLSFLTQLDTASKSIVEDMIGKRMLGDKAIMKATIGKEIPCPSSNHQLFEGYWIPLGPKNPESSAQYILTPSVQKNVKDLARVVSLGKTFPVLLQGETSVGKTSLIQWLAKATGNVCRRVNNHEHTDLEEYVGSYCSDADGNLVFREGVLVEAMRKGYWIILDELNLAPTEVLEALNRVLDDNRELFIPETQVTVKAHPNFVLFATQNPPGLYGGRKILSRAFRNRFVELHFDEIPSNELIVILEKRCLIPASYAKKMVLTMSDLQRNRRGSEIFAGKSGFITLRDLFRWGDRFRVASESISATFFDWDLFLAEMGFMVLAGRVRKEEEENLVREALEKRFLRNKQTLDVSEIYHKLSHEMFSCHFPPQQFKHIVATDSFRRLVALVWSALKFREPVLLVGETGCGKTSICQLYSLLSDVALKSVNCHMHSEGSDFLGNLRPVRCPEKGGPLFQWVNGPLVEALQQGCVFLMDEISLADDSVLERLNSILEPERTLLLSEKGLDDANPESLIIHAHDSFRFVATMNPGGDYGKKELSPALRNRFTEIWCPSTNSKEDLESIVKHNLQDHLSENGKKIASIMSSFSFWLKSKLPGNTICSIRDILSWLNFVNSVTLGLNGTKLSLPAALVHGAQLVFIDALGCGGFNCSQDASLVSGIRTACVDKIESLTRALFQLEIEQKQDEYDVTTETTMFQIGPFCISCLPNAREADGFTFDTDGIRRNAMKVLRGMQLSKPILLEGAPGVGKTSLVQALAQQTGHEVVRINLSEQTDISDLFGSDLPVEGDNMAGRFQWRDGPLLQALKSASTWIVLDEMNLASQSVLEGLNACLDHRGEIFVAELGRTFSVDKSETRIFACQNPYREGGDRKGLPRSFLNRFTIVYVDSFTDNDLTETTIRIFPQIGRSKVEQIVRFNQQVRVCIRERQFTGPEWEMNLRDIFRCCTLISSSADVDDNITLSDAIQLVYSDRLRCHPDRDAIASIYASVFGQALARSFPDLVVTPDRLFSGSVLIQRTSSSPPPAKLTLKSNQISCLSSLMKCVTNNWLAILVADSSEEASNIVRVLSSLSGSKLRSQTVNSQTDAIELLGGFEQKDLSRRLREIENAAWETTQKCLQCDTSRVGSHLLSLWNSYSKLLFQNDVSEKDVFDTKLRHLESIFEKSSLSSAFLQEVRELRITLSEMKDLRCGGSFEWLDSQLILAMKEGHWLLVEDANMCPPSVLDRLNSLFEPNGKIVMTEQGSVNGSMRIISPHPLFRLFMTMDPANGELSRAMRNRGVEIFLQTSSDPCLVIDVNATVADPVVAKVMQFPSAILSESDLPDRNSLQVVICRLFLQSSSKLDFGMRVKQTDNFVVSPATNPQFVSESGSPGHPIDSRHLLFHQMSNSQIKLVNKWLFALYRKFHSTYLNLDAEIGISELLPTDEQLFALRLFSQITIGHNASKHIISVIKNKFQSRIAGLIDGISCRPDDDVKRIEEWIELVRHFASAICLTTNEDRSLDAHEALKLLNIWERIEDQSFRKLIVNKKLADFFHLISCTDSKNEEITEAADGIRKSVTEEDCMISQQCDPMHSCIFNMIFVLFEREAVRRNKVVQFFCDPFLCQRLLDKISVHPLHRFYAQKEDCLTEHVLHHFRDSHRIQKSLNTKKTRLNSKDSPNVTSVLLNGLSGKTATLGSASHHMAAMTDIKELLLLCVFTENLFDSHEASAAIANRWLQKLEDLNAKLPPELSFGAIRAAYDFALNADATDPLRHITASAIHVLQTGLVSALVLAPHLLVDPMEIRAQEIIHFEAQQEIVSGELDVWERIAHLERGVDHRQFVNTHPHLKMLNNQKVMLESEVAAQKQLLTFRPKKYARLRTSVLTFEKTVLCGLVQEMTAMLPMQSQFHQKTIKKWETTRHSVSNFADKMMNEYLDYWDIVSPFVASLYIMDSGLRSLLQVMELAKDPAQLNRVKILNHFVESCCNFFDSDLLATNRYLQSQGSVFIQSFNSDNPKSPLSRLPISAVMDIRNYLSLRTTMDPDLFVSCVTILNGFVLDWKAQQEEKEAEKRMREATIHCRTFEGEADGEALEQEELARVFPSYAHSFTGLVSQYDPSDPPAVVPKSDNHTSDECSLLIDLHRAIVQPDGKVDLFTPFCIKYDVLAQISANTAPLMASINHAKLVPLHAFACQNSQIQMRKSSASTDPKFDFYHDCDEHEVQVCRDLLSNFRATIESILASWPDHPTLLRLLKVTDRIFEFDITSPLAKFLTGIELLLDQAQEWEKVYASREFKITQHMDNMTSLIIAWRKLELSHWSNCLDIVRRQVEEKDEKQWWFHLFHLVHDFDKLSAGEVVETLKQFIETASVGQFMSRLRLLLLFSDQVRVTRGDSMLLNALHNVHDFYQQFGARVSSVHDSGRKPIEKEVKDFVRVQQWNDFNYWSLKTSIDKSHKVLNKQMKRYGLVLNKTVSSHLVIEEQIAHPASLKSQFTMAEYLVKIDVSEESLRYMQDVDVSEKPELLIKNLQRYSKKIMDTCMPIRMQIEDEEESIVSIISEVQELQNMKLDASLTDPEARKKAVHHMNNRKRKSLSNLFKFLSDEGLSWTAGSHFFQSFCVNQAFMSVARISLDDADAPCNKYFFSCLARLAQLKSSLAEPSKELSPGDLDRIGGFVGNMVELLIRHRKSLAIQTVALNECESFLNNLRAREEQQNDVFVSFKVLLAKLDYLISDANAVPDNIFVQEEVHISQIRALVSNGLNSAMSIEVIKDVLTQLLSLIPVKNLLTDEIRRILMTCEESHSKFKSLETMTLPEPDKESKTCIVHSLKAIEKMVELVTSHDFENDNLKKLLCYDSFWKSLGMCDFAPLLRQLNPPENGNNEPLCDISHQLIDQYLKVSRFTITLAIEAQRVFGKMLHVLLGVFVKLIQEGYCLPPEALPEETAGEGTDQLTGTGMADGQGSEDVSDRITSEDQLEDAHQDGEEKDSSRDDEDVKEEEGGIEMEGDFDGDNYDVNDKNEEDDKESSDDELSADDKVGENVDDELQTLNKKLWENEEAEEEEEAGDNDDGGKGEEFGEREVVAADGDRKDQMDEEKEQEAGNEHRDDAENENQFDDEYDGEHRNDPKEPGAAEKDDDKDIELPEEMDLDADETKTSDVAEDSETESAKADASDHAVDEGEEHADGEPIEREADDGEADAERDEDEEADFEMDDHEKAKLPDQNPSEETDAVASHDVTCAKDHVPATDPHQNSENEFLNEPMDSTEEHGIGEGQVGEDRDGHEGYQQSAAIDLLKNRRRQKDFAADSARSFSQADRPLKRQKILPSHEGNKESHDEHASKEQESGSLFQHIRDGEHADDEVIDQAARDEAMRSRPNEENEPAPKPDSDDDFLGETSDEDEMKGNDITKGLPRHEKDTKKKSAEKTGLTTDDPVEVCGEPIPTESVLRGPETSYHTKTELLSKSGERDWMKLLTTVTRCRSNGQLPLEEASLLWNECGRTVSSLVYELCQQLQLVLEPSKCSKLKGDYRTGKRINMRKVVAYIASQFRKDKIWLRRTKPSKRMYQIVLAVDDSRSMLDNETKLMAFHSLALLSKSLSLIEAGQLAVLSFGEEVRLLHSLDQPFSDEVGPRLLTHFTFDQKQTRITSLLETTCDLLLKSKQASSARSASDVSQLLLIISDGRGVFNDGTDTLNLMVRRLNDAGVFCVFVILDNPQNSQSIFDITSVDFRDGKAIKKNYMDDFPFPFYIVLRDIRNMPAVLGESLRQWFELLASAK